MGVIDSGAQTWCCFDAFPMKNQKAISRVRPGLSGVGSIVFCNEEAIMRTYNLPTISTIMLSCILRRSGSLVCWKSEFLAISEFDHFNFLSSTILKLEPTPRSIRIIVQCCRNICSSWDFSHGEIPDVMRESQINKNPKSRKIEESNTESVQAYGIGLAIDGFKGIFYLIGFSWPLRFTVCSY